MFCPDCGVEYREGFAQCADCGVPLVHEPPAPAHAYTPWVSVFETSDPFTISLAKSSLEDAEIPFHMDGDITEARLVLGPIGYPLCSFVVPPEREAEARELLGVFTKNRAG